MIFFFLIAALVAAATAVPTTHTVNPVFPIGRIVGGEDAVIETYPYQISLELNGRHNCGGSIISANFILTAAHCVRYPVDTLSIRAGTSTKLQGGSVHEVLEIIPHEDYYSIGGIPANDIALIRVKEPFQFDDTRQPINLFDDGEEATAGVMSVVTGWGNTGKGSPIQLQTVTIPIISKDLCKEAYDSYGQGLSDGQICAAYYGVGGKDACQGDSGGPLAIDGRLAGIVSWGNGCALPYFPGAYTEVASYRQWINDHAEF